MLHEHMVTQRKTRMTECAYHSASEKTWAVTGDELASGGPIVRCDRGKASDIQNL